MKMLNVLGILILLATIPIMAGLVNLVTIIAMRPRSEGWKLPRAFAYGFAGGLILEVLVIVFCGLIALGLLLIGHAAALPAVDQS